MRLLNTIKAQFGKRLNGDQRAGAVGAAVAGLLTATMLLGSANTFAPDPANAAEGKPGAISAGQIGRSTKPSKAGSAAKPASKKAVKPPAWVVPMPVAPVSSCYGPRWGTMHKGMDFAGNSGTPIRAVGAGTVFGAGWLYTGYGQSVVIDHGHGTFSHYAHASRVLVHAGQRIRPGQIIALEGSTGDSTGPHLHFEIHLGQLWNQVNPAPWLRQHGVRIAGC